MNSLQALQNYGQSVWLDYIQHNLITSGKLQRLIHEDEEGVQLFVDAFDQLLSAVEKKSAGVSQRSSS